MPASLIVRNLLSPGKQQEDLEYSILAVDNIHF